MKKLLSAASVFSLALCFLPSAAAVTLSSDALSLDEPVSENVYVMGGSIAINAPVQGDVVAFGGDVIINAPVSGDVLVAGGTVTIQSDVMGDIRAAASQMALTGSKVSGDIVYAGSRMSMDSTSSASGALMIQSGQVVLQATTDKEVTVRASDVTFGGTHAGPVQIETDRIQFLGGTNVEGVISYTANTVKDSAALTAQTINQSEAPVQPWTEIAMSALTVAMYVSVATLLLLVLTVRTAPLWSMDVTERMHKKGPSSLFLGLFLLLSLPSIIAFLLGLQIVWAPFAVVFLPATILIALLSLVLLILSPAMIALFLARLLPVYEGEPLPLWVSLPVGALLTGIIVSLPYVGLFIGAWLLCLAIGSMAQTQTRFLGVFEKRIRKSKKAE